MPWFFTALMIGALVALLAAAFTESPHWPDDDEDEGKWHG